MSREAILKRAQRLYAMAHQTTSENEALVAAEKLAKLQAEHEISLSELGAAARRAENPMGTGYSAKTARVRAHPTTIYTANAIGIFTDTVPWVKGSRIAYFGERSDVEMAAWLTTMLMVVSELEYQDWYTRNHIPGIKQHGSFMRGFAARVSARLKEMKQQQQQDLYTQTGRELMVVKRQQVQIAFAQHGPKLRKGSASASRNYSSAYTAGQDAGNKVGLNRPIGGDSPKGLPGN